MGNEQTYKLDEPLMVKLHPGSFLQEELEARGISQRALAKLMNTENTIVNDLIKGRRSFTAKTSLDLEIALGIKATMWMHLQNSYDLTKERKARGLAV